jgi:UDP-2,3-diacylglucosamine pyrophosphatase LpxH
MNKTQVISDLHIGAGPLDDCDHELEAGLCAFIQHLAKDGTEHELVIAGDFLDFAQAPPTEGRDLSATSARGIPLCFTEAQSNEKLDAILNAHPSVGASLSEFLRGNRGNRLVIMPGNHDADFFWPSVRAAFIDDIVRGTPSIRARIRFHLDPVYRPPTAPAIWIEHGHQYDPLNSFFVDGEPLWSETNPPILIDTRGVPRLLECIGTRFMVRFMNRLDALYPFVDNVKPFTRFLKLFGASIFASGHGPKKVAFAILALLRFVGQTDVRRVGDLLSTDTPDAVAFSLANLLRRGFNEDTRRTLQGRLRDAGFNIDRPLTMLVEDPARSDALVAFIADRLDLLDGLDEADVSDLLGAEDGTLALGQEFLFGDETKRLIRAAQTIIDRGDATQVIMGHTHEPVVRGAPSPYLNIGCWTRYYTFEPKERTRPFHILGEGGYEAFPYRLQYAEIEGTAPATLRVFRERHKEA